MSFQAYLSREVTSQFDEYAKYIRNEVLDWFSDSEGDARKQRKTKYNTYRRANIAWALSRAFRTSLRIRTRLYARLVRGINTRNTM